MNWILGIAIVSVALLLVEAALLRRVAGGVPCRILITGTRGKSSLVKILLAGIRTIEPAAWGKITGDTALLLAPGGTSRKLVRRGPAHLREQARFLRSCGRNGARCVVLESMAISPEAMVAESRLVRPTLVIVTNVRDDHRETLGCDRDGQRAAYLASLPRHCRWLTLDAELLSFATRSGKYPPPVQHLSPGNESSYADGFDAVSELLATAESALETLDLNTEPARSAMSAAAAQVIPAPRSIALLGQEFTLLDAFSANDPLSLDRLWAEWRKDGGDTSDWSVLLNTRADRPLRTRQFCRWLAGRRDIDRVFVAGSHHSTASRLLRRNGMQVIKFPDGEAASLSETSGVPSAEGNKSVLVGIGNARGLGKRLRATGCGSIC